MKIKLTVQRWQKFRPQKMISNDDRYRTEKEKLYGNNNRSKIRAKKTALTWKTKWYSFLGFDYETNRHTRQANTRARYVRCSNINWFCYSCCEYKAIADEMRCAKIAWVGWLAVLSFRSDGWSAKCVRCWVFSRIHWQLARIAAKKKRAREKVRTGCW